MRTLVALVVFATTSAFSGLNTEKVEGYQSRIQHLLNAKKECKCDTYDALIKEGVQRINSLVKQAS